MIRLSTLKDHLTTEAHVTRPSNPELPDKILEVAEQVVMDHGHKALNMRLVAEQVGVTPTTLYYYFKSKDHILLELKLRAARMLNESIDNIDPAQGPASALRALGEAYIRFAEENPHLYRLLMEVKLDGSVASEEDYETLCFSYYAARRMLETMAEEGVRKFDPAKLAMIGWVLLHGFSSLLIAGTLESVTKFDRDQLRTAFLKFYSIEETRQDGPKSPDAR
jgi:AcrR family transcriptional regulator